ncbi:peptidoglycan editing factor PgeF [Virgibacillus sediminis]|uniref:Purine nucleoside phosphorylase n=1 Tax=Virgibacillus sediminis TaxID=202260 RepID=A0ABV7AAQ6_9BACI
MQEPFIYQENLYLHIKRWQQINPQIRAGFTTRSNGVSHPPFQSLNMGLHVNDDVNHVTANRQKLAKHVGIPMENWVVGEQVHHTNIKRVTEQDKGKGSFTLETAVPDTDGLITNEKGILCGAVFADCVPLFFFDPVTGFIGIAHAGWKGTVQRMAEKMVDKFRSLGTEPSNLLAVVGPSISRENYEVDERVIQSLSPKERERCVQKQGENRYLLDLKQLNADILLQAGVLRNNIDITKYCTYEHNHLFFSHRRDQGESGRMLGYIGYQS